MIQLYYSERDSTLYERYPSLNTGIDQILQLIKIVSGSKFENTIFENTYNSRFLIDFGAQINSIASSISSGKIPPIGPKANGSASVYLNIRLANATDLPTSYTLYAFPVSESWNNGNGNFNDIPQQTNGVSWYYRDNDTLATRWNTASAASVGNNGLTEIGGGTWITGSGFEASQSFTITSESDIRMDVTDIVRNWIAGTIPNHGFIVKRSTTDERSDELMGDLRFFGNDTQTIYIPRLEIVWNDSEFSGTGSVNEITDETFVPYITNIRNEYRVDDQTIFRIKTRPQFPVRTYTTSSRYTTNYRLPTSSYYSIIDGVTNETLIPFDTDATKISCDTNGSYFKLRLSAFQPERYYRIVLKVERDGGDDVQTFSEGFYFKVVK